MSWVLYSHNGSPGTGTDAEVDDDSKIRKDCAAELKHYLSQTGLRIRNSKGGYNNPLLWWKMKEEVHPVLALLLLAAAFLSIPATSAPSERVWSRSSLVMSTKRASLSDKVSSGIMCVKENLEVLQKHYKQLTKDDKDALPLEISGLPVPRREADLANIDVGQDIINKEF